MSEWQPIETAPKDGTKVLLGRFTGSKSALREGYTATDWYGQPGDKRDLIGWGEFNTTHWPPTHWLPIPAPPSLQDKKD